ncbi:MAG: archease [Candidatus Hermodarchaeota archaeon]|nr:archease [Candidatus Hermodarchaeota archaeon]
MDYEYPDEITSDQMFRAYGKTLQEVFINAAKAMFGVMYDLNEVQIETSIQIKAEGETLENLLYNWLSNLLIEFEVEGVFFKDFTIDAFEKRSGPLYELTGRAMGGHAMPELQTHVKGVTFYKFALERVNNQYIATVVVDV